MLKQYKITFVTATSSKESAQDFLPSNAYNQLGANPQLNNWGPSIITCISDVPPRSHSKIFNQIYLHIHSDTTNKNTVYYLRSWQHVSADNALWEEQHSVWKHQQQILVFCMPVGLPGPPLTYIPPGHRYYGALIYATHLISCHLPGITAWWGTMLPLSVFSIYFANTSVTTMASTQAYCCLKE